MTHTKRTMQHVAVGALLATTLGCSKGTTLEPAKDARETGPLGSDTAFTRASDVLVTADGNRWTGDADVKRHVTPVWMEIRNHSDAPIEVLYTSIHLAGPGGAHFAALPPVDADGRISIDIDAVKPRFGYERFSLAPHYGTLYSGVEVSPPRGMGNRKYYDELYDRWEAEVPLPTLHMLEVAMPEGTIEPGGRVNGFVYFEHVEGGDGSELTLEVELLDSESGAITGIASIPFVTD